MIQNGYEEKINIKYSETDQNLAMKPFALLNFLQDIASKNAEDLGFGYSFIQPKNLAWFLIKYHMEFEEYPFDTQELILKTEPRGYNKLFAFRDFELYSGEKLLGRMHSMWSIVDINSRSMVPVSVVFSENQRMAPFQKREDDLAFTKIAQITIPTLEKDFEVRYNDLDVNGHANNGNYIVWALEPLSFDFRNKYKIKSLDMVYKKEAKFGEKLTSQIEFLDTNTTVHRLQNLNGEDLFQMQCVWG
jgi:medium-chain acyl-[acyl-carrier-protein] hydrolase